MEQHNQERLRAVLEAATALAATIFLGEIATGMLKPGGGSTGIPENSPAPQYFDPVTHRLYSAPPQHE